MGKCHLKTPIVLRHTHAYFPSSVKRGVSAKPVGRFDRIISRDPRFAGSKDRLERAKTIDLCQNPLTVSAVAMKLDRCTDCHTLMFTEGA
jgi:hypothetical protein